MFESSSKVGKRRCSNRVRKSESGDVRIEFESRKAEIESSSKVGKRRSNRV